MKFTSNGLTIEIATADIDFDKIGELMLQYSADGKGGNFVMEMTDEELALVRELHGDRYIQILAHKMRTACDHEWYTHYSGQGNTFRSEDQAVPPEKFNEQATTAQ